MWGPAENQNVSGLYQRAIEYLQSQRRLRLVRPEENEDFQGTPEERAQIEAEIRRAVDENRINVGPDTFRIRPRKRGAGLPILVNVFALLLIVGGVYVLLQLFEAQEEDLVSRTGTVASAEGRLLSALREESAQALSRKDAEIAEIERRLADAQAEREQIRSDAETRLAEREAELRAEFEAALEAERARLAEENLTDAERTTRLAAFRAEREGELERDIAALEEEARADVAAQEAALASLVAEYEQTLGDARTEREALRAELAEREAELEAQYEQRAAELSDERAAAVRLLEELEAQQEQRQLILDQILGFYAGARASISEGDYQAAGASLDALRDYLESGPIGSIPDLQRRRQVELFLVDTLEQRLTTLAGSDDGDARSLVESAGLVAEVGELISQAEGSYGSGEVERARELYVAALSRIPAVRIGYDRLEEIEAEIEASQTERVAGLIEDGNVLYRDGEYDAAVERYGAALAALPAPSDELLARLLDAGYQLRAADSFAELADLRDELAVSEARLRGTRETIATQQATLARSETTIAERDASIADLREQLRGVGELLAAERERVAQLEEAAAAAEAAASETASRAGPSEDLANARDELAAARESQARLEEQLAETEAELASARASVRASEETVRTTRELIDELESRAAAAAEELAANEAELEESQAELALLRERRREQEALADRIETYRRAFERDTEAPAGSAGSLELLETKLLILRIVGSDAVRADYPDLYDQLNAYLDALVAEQRSEAVEATLADLDGLLTRVATGSRATVASIDELAGVYPALASPSAREERVRVLRQLEELFGVQ